MMPRFKGYRVAVFILLLPLLTACASMMQPGDTRPEPWPLVWLDVDGDCQDTETEVLISEAVGLLQWGDPDACSIAFGQWKSWSLDQALPMTAILVVALVLPEKAYQSGAEDWSREKKVEFLNDPENLIILDLASARVRANYGPDRWVPHRNYWCKYASRWQSVKKRYGLTMTEEELGATEHMKAVACSSE